MEEVASNTYQAATSKENADAYDGADGAVAGNQSGQRGAEAAKEGAANPKGASVNATQESEFHRREWEAEQRRRRNDPHGEIITDGDLRAWKRDQEAKFHDHICRNCVSYEPSFRARAECLLHGKLVYGREKFKLCWKQRGQ